MTLVMFVLSGHEQRLKSDISEGDFSSRRGWAKIWPLMEAVWVLESVHELGAEPLGRLDTFRFTDQTNYPAK